MMDTMDHSEAETPGLVPCRCISQPPIIFRPQFDQNLNDTIQQCFGIRKECANSESVSTPFALQNVTCSSIDRTKTFMLDESPNAAVDPFISSLHSNVNNFPIDNRLQPDSPIGNVRLKFTDGNVQLSKGAIIQEQDFSDMFPEENFEIPQNEVTVKKEPSQDEFADLWAAFGSLPAVMSTNSSNREASISNNFPLHPNVLPNNGDQPFSHSHASSDHAFMKFDVNDSNLATDSLEQQPYSVVRKSSSESVFSDSKDFKSIQSDSQAGIATCPTNLLPGLVATEMGNLPSPYQFGFSTASGRKIVISAEMLKKGEQFLEESIPEEVGFSTASGKSIQISDEMKKLGQSILVDCTEGEHDFSGTPPAVKQEPLDLDQQATNVSFSTAFGKASEVLPHEEVVPREIKSEAINVVPPKACFSFATASGKEIKFSSENLQKGDQILRNVKSEPVDVDQVVSSFGFATASGKNVDVTPEMIRRGEKLLREESDLVESEAPKFEPDTACNSVTTASGLEMNSLTNMLPTGGDLLGDIESLSMDVDEAPATITLSTASGKKVDLTPEMIQKGDQLLRKDNALSMASIDKDLVSSTGSRCPSREKTPKGSAIHHLVKSTLPLRTPDTKPKSLSNSINSLGAEDCKAGEPKISRCFGFDLTNAHEKPTAISKATYSRHTVSTSKRIREKSSLMATFKTPSPIIKIQNSIAAVHLQTPPSSQAAPFRKRLKFTPPISRTTSSANRLPVPSPKKQMDVSKLPSSKNDSSVSPRIPKIGFKEFADKVADLKKAGKMLGYLPSDDVRDLTSTLSTSYTFPDGKTWSTVYHNLVDAGSSTTWVSEDWVKNHYRWIVWKLASIERRLEVPSLQYDRVLKQISRRYQQEFIESRRSCLKMITEHDNSPGGFLVLCIASVNVDRKTIELTDGWYSVYAELDAGLKKVLSEGKLYAGLKLRLFNCSLSDESSPCTPLENTSKRLRLSINCTRRAPRSARLGYQTRGPFLTSLNSLKPKGGVAPKLRLKILRVMPIQFTEKMLVPIGGPSKVLTRAIVRNQLSEDAASIAHEKQMHALQDILEDGLAEKSVDCLLARIQSPKSISAELAEKISSELQDEKFERVAEVLKEKICRRAVSTIHRYIVESAKTESNPLPRTYILNLSNAKIEGLRCGSTISVTQMDCISGPYGSLTLSSTSRSHIKVERRPPCLPKETLTFDFSCHDLTMGLFFDVSGLLVLRTSSSVAICSAAIDTELLIVQLGADWISPNIKSGQFITIENLFYNGFDSRLSCHSAFGRGTASIHVAKMAVPVPSHFEFQCRRASAIIDPVNNPIVQNLPDIRSISRLIIEDMEIQTESRFGQDYFGFKLGNISLIARKELLAPALADQNISMSLSKRRVCVWVVAEIESQHVLIAEAIEFS